MIIQLLLLNSLVAVFRNRNRRERKSENRRRKRKREKRWGKRRQKLPQAKKSLYAPLSSPGFWLREYEKKKRISQKMSPVISIGWVRGMKGPFANGKPELFASVEILGRKVVELELPPLALLR
jgi:hypothetical protein